MEWIEIGTFNTLDAAVAFALAWLDVNWFTWNGIVYDGWIPVYERRRGIWMVLAHRRLAFGPGGVGD